MDRRALRSLPSVALRFRGSGLYKDGSKVMGIEDILFMVDETGEHWALMAKTEIAVAA